LKLSPGLRALAARHRAPLVFATIGVANTALHTATLVALVELLATPPVAAQAAGFLVANLASFLGNARYAFRRRPTLAGYGKFLLVSLTSLALTLALAALAQARHWHYLVGLLLAVLLGPPLSYLLHRCYTFRLPVP